MGHCNFQLKRELIHFYGSFSPSPNTVRSNRPLVFVRILKFTEFSKVYRIRHNWAVLKYNGYRILRFPLISVRVFDTYNVGRFEKSKLNRW